MSDTTHNWLVMSVCFAILIVLGLVGPLRWMLP